MTAWNPDVANGAVYAIAPASNGAVQVGGSFTQIGAQVVGAFATLAP